MHTVDSVILLNMVLGEGPLDLQPAEGRVAIVDNDGEVVQAV
jgi:hypothetical protein